MAAQQTNLVPELIESNEGNVSFIDGQKSVTPEISPSTVSLRTKAIEGSEVDVARELFGRWLQIGTMDIKSSQGVGSDVANFSFPSAFYNSRFTRNSNTSSILRNYAFFRGDVELKFVVNANKFMVGQLQASAYYASDLDMNFDDRANVYLRSQMTHQLISLHNNQSVLFSLPFAYPKQFIRTRSAKDCPARDFVSVKVLTLNRLAVAEGNPVECTVSVFARLLNVHLSGMVPNSLPLPEHEMLSAIATMSSVIKLGEQAVNFVRGINNDSPRDPRPDSVVIPRQTSSWALGRNIVSPANVLRLDSRGNTSELVKDEMKVSSIVQTYGLLAQFTWSATSHEGASLWKGEVAPIGSNVPKLDTTEPNLLATYAVPPVGVIASCFAYWRGSIKYRFDFIASFMHTGRVIATFYPALTSENPSISFSDRANLLQVIFDLEEAQSFTFEVPFTWDKEWCSIHSSDRNNNDFFPFGIGRIDIQVMNQLIVNESIVNKIDVNVYVCGGADFEVSVPVNPELGLGWDRIYRLAPTGDIKFRAGYGNVAVGVWRYFWGSTGAILRYGEIQDHIAQIDGGEFDKVYTFSDGTKLQSPTETTPQYAYFVSPRIYGDPPQYLAAFKTLEDAKTFITDGRPVFLPKNTPSGKYVNCSKKILQVVWDGQAVRQFAREMHAFHEAADDIVANPLSSVNSLAIEAFGESFDDLKDLVRRYQYYGDYSSLVPASLPYGSTLLRIPISFAGLIVDPSRTVEVDEIQNRMRNGIIPVIASGFRFFSGSLRMRIIATSSDPNLFLQAMHVPELSATDWRFQFPQYQHNKDFITTGYAGYGQSLRMNQVLDLEIPYYLPGSCGLLQRNDLNRVDDMRIFSTLGNLEVSCMTPIIRETQMDIRVFFAAADDTRFSHFTGFPKMVLPKQVPEAVPPKSSDHTGDKLLRYVRENMKGFWEGIPPHPQSINRAAMNDYCPPGSVIKKVSGTYTLCLSFYAGHIELRIITASPTILLKISPHGWKPIVPDFTVEPRPNQVAKLQELLRLNKSGEGYVMPEFMYGYLGSYGQKILDFARLGEPLYMTKIVQAILKRVASEDARVQRPQVVAHVREEAARRAEEERIRASLEAAKNAKHESGSVPRKSGVEHESGKECYNEDGILLQEICKILNVDFYEVINHESWTDSIKNKIRSGYQFCADLCISADQASNILTQFNGMLMGFLDTCTMIAGRFRDSLNQMVLQLVNIITNPSPMAFAMGVTSILISLAQCSVAQAGILATMTACLTNYFATYIRTAILFEIPSYVAYTMGYNFDHGIADSQHRRRHRRQTNSDDCRYPAFGASCSIEHESDSDAPAICTMLVSVAALYLGVKSNLKVPGSIFKGLVRGVPKVAVTHNHLILFFRNIFEVFSNLVKWIWNKVYPRENSVKDLFENDAELLSWAKDALYLSDESLLPAIASSPNLITEFQKINVKGMKYSLALADPKTVLPPGVCVQITSILRQLKTMSTKLLKRGVAHCSRFEPYVLYISGDSGVGKSQMVRNIVKKMLERVGVFTTKPIYTRNPGTAHWDALENQPVVLFDDFMAVNSPESTQDSELFALKTSGDFIPPMASLEDKGMYYNPLIVVCCANDAFPTNARIKCPEAFHRRRDFLAHVQPADWVKVEAMRQGVSATELIAKVPPVEVAEFFDNFDHLEFSRQNDVQDPKSSVKKYPLKMKLDSAGDYTRDVETSSYSEFEKQLLADWFAYYNKQISKWMKDTKEQLKDKYAASGMTLDELKDSVDSPSLKSLVKLSDYAYQSIKPTLDGMGYKDPVKHQSDEVEGNITSPSEMKGLSVEELKEYADSPDYQATVNRDEWNRQVNELDQMSANLDGTVNITVPEGDTEAAVRLRILRNATPSEYTDATSETASSSVADQSLISLDDEDGAQREFDEEDVRQQVCDYNTMHSKCEHVPLLKSYVEMNYYRTPRNAYGHFAVTTPNNVDLDITEEPCDSNICIFLDSNKMLARCYLNPYMKALLQKDELFAQNVPRCYTTSREPPKKKVERTVAIMESQLQAGRQDPALQSAWKKLKDTKIYSYISEFNNTMKILLAFIGAGVAVIAAVYGAKRLARSSSSEELEEVISESSGDSRVRGTRKNRNQNQKKRRAMENIWYSQHESGRTQAADELMNIVSSNSGFMTFISRNGTEKRTKCLGITGSFLYSLHHFFEDWKANGRPALSFSRNGGLPKPFTLNDDAIITNLNSSLCLVKLPSMFPSFRDIRKHFATNDELDNIPQLADLCSINYVTKTMDIKSVRVSFQDSLQIDGTDTMSPQSLDFVFSYRHHGKGLCGSTLISRGSVPKIIGLHVAGSGTQGTGFAQPVCKEQIKHLQTVDVLTIPVGPESGGLDPTCTDPSPMIKPDTELELLGTMDRDIVPHLPTKTRIVPLPTQGAFNEVLEEPAVLSPGDPRLKENNLKFSPLEEGVKKHGLPPIPFPEPLVISAAADISEKLMAVAPPVFARRDELLSDQEIVCGIPGEQGYTSMDLNTSEGYPLQLDRPNGVSGKKWLIETEVEDNRLVLKSLHPKLQSLREVNAGKRAKNIAPNTIFVDALKDCTVKKEKVLKKGATRIFSASPLEFTMVVKKYFGHFAASMNQNRIKNEISVGINPEGAEWSQVVMYLREVARTEQSHIVTGDYSHYGDSLQSECLLQAFEVMIAWYDRYYGHCPDHQEHNRIRRVICQEFLHVQHLAGNLVYRMFCGLPSGFALTVELNSLVNMMYMRVAWKYAMKDTQLSAFSEFNKNVRLLVYGDDLIMSVSSDTIEHFNFVSIQEFLRKHDIAFTHSSKVLDYAKPSELLTEATFLKRGFVSHPNRKFCFLSPLPDASIYGQLDWGWKNDDMEALVFSNMRSALNDAHSRGKKFFNVLRDKCMRWISENPDTYEQHARLDTWDEIDRRVFKDVDFY